MRKLKFILFMAVLPLFFASCSKVPAGNVGIKFYLLGGDKGVDHEVLEPGRYHIGINEELFLFPTFTQNYVWTASEDEGSKNDESFSFQDKQGLELSADIGITYHLEKAKVPLIFQKYKRGINEITDIFLRNMVRDALVTTTSTLDVEYIYGEGRAVVLDSVTNMVKNSCEPLGINIDKIYWIGSIVLPPTVKAAVDAKIEATQKAQQVENQLREAEAKAKKTAAAAQGVADSIRIVSTAEAEANIRISKSLTPTLIQYKKIEQWDGNLPTVTGGSIPMIDIK